MIVQEQFEHVFSQLNEGGGAPEVRDSLHLCVLRAAYRNAGGAVFAGAAISEQDSSAYAGNVPIMTRSCNHW